eukprot:7072461-Pyramimonas_sp.AAC.1
MARSAIASSASRTVREDARGVRHVTLSVHLRLGRRVADLQGGADALVIEVAVVDLPGRGFAWWARQLPRRLQLDRAIDRGDGLTRLAAQRQGRVVAL